MILNRLMRQGGLNWKYAIGEVLLIFIGISLSLTFDQWRTNNSNKTKEKELMILLVESVKNDIEDLEYKINESDKTLKAIGYLIAKLTDNNDFSDSVSRAFSLLGYNPQLHPDKLGYDNILATGLSIVSDNDLRKEIIEYYSRVEDNVAWGQGVQKHIDEYISPIIIKDFQDYNFLEKGVPFDFNKMKSDKFFINVLKKSQRLNIVSLYRLKDHKTHADKFLKHLTSDGNAR